MIAMTLLLVAVASPGEAADGGPGRARVTADAPPAPASFTIAAAGREGAWHAKTSDGCRFGFELASTKSAFTKGAFIREKGGSCAPFLSRLALALETKQIPAAKKAERVEFDATVLGVDLQRQPSGGFSGKGGGWTATKLFLGEENAEVYLNFNPHTGEAEFSIKESDYGEDVLRLLAAVL